MSALDDVIAWARREVFSGGMPRRPTPSFEGATAELAALRTEVERLRGALRTFAALDVRELLVIRHEDAGDVCAVCCRGPLWKCAEGCPVPSVLAVMESLP
jgi:hypothetical protein